MLIRWKSVVAILWLVSLTLLGRAEAVFVSGTDGYHTYRIPALLTATNGTLLAFAEGRKNGAGDSGDIDIVLKTSSDNGKTWSAQRVLWDDTANTCGNPCAVQDRVTGTIFLLLTHNLGNDHEKEINTSKAVGGRTVWLMKSEDDGAHWSAPEEITSSVKKADWRWYATGPGIGIQMEAGPHKGRLVVPCDHTVTNGDTVESRSHIIYSDDHGKSWKIGGTIRPAMNECQVAELNDNKGSLLMSMRNLPKGSNRAQSTSHDGGLTWTDPIRHPQLIDPTCQASIIAYGVAGKKSCLVFSNPADSSRRQHLTVRASYDDGKTWPDSKVLFPKAAAYSCLTVLHDGEIGCLFECGEKNANEGIQFMRFPLSSLSH